MTYVWGLAGCAVLFTAMGLVMRWTHHRPGCGSCTTSCPAKESRHG